MRWHRSERTQKVQQILLGLRRQKIEIVYHRIGFGLRAGMRKNGLEPSSQIG
jgi:hypothetical protein